jgi:hypothetical protein
MLRLTHTKKIIVSLMVVGLCLGSYAQAQFTGPGSDSGVNVGPGSNSNINTGPGSNSNVNTGPGSNSVVENPLKYDTIGKLISAILTVVVEIGAIVGVLFIIWSGFLFVAAQGNQDKLKRAKSTFWTTIIGLAILLGASVITKIIFNTISSVSK